MTMSVVRRSGPDDTELDGIYGMQRTAGGSRPACPRNRTIPRSASWSSHAGPDVDARLLVDRKRRHDRPVRRRQPHGAGSVVICWRLAIRSCSGNSATRVVRNSSGTVARGTGPVRCRRHLPGRGRRSTSTTTTRISIRVRVKGHDIGVYFDVDTSFGDFTFAYNGSFLDKYEQVPGGLRPVLIAAKDSRDVARHRSSSTALAAWSRRDGNRTQQTVDASSVWRNGDWGAALPAYDWRFVPGIVDTRRWSCLDRLDVDDDLQRVGRLSFDVRRYARGAFRNRQSHGRTSAARRRQFRFLGDSHRDLGRSYYVDLRLQF